MQRIIGRILDNAVIPVVVLALMTIGLGIFLHHNRVHKLNSHFAQHQEALVMAYQASIQMYRLAMDGFFANTVSRPEIAGVFAEGVRSGGYSRALAKGRLYRRLYPQYMAMKNHNLLQLHFHQADGTSFLRFHQPDRHGDSLLDGRHSVALANSERRPVHGFETGRIRSGFRYVYPISWEGGHVGSVEVSVTAKGIREAMAELDPHREYAFYLRRQIVEPQIFPEQRWIYSTAPLHPDLIMEDADALLPDSPPPLSEEAKAVNRHLRHNVELQEAIDRGGTVTLAVAAGDKPYIVSLLPIRDVEAHVAGYLVTYAPDGVTATYRREFVLYMVTAAAALSLIATLLLGLRRRTAALGRERRSLQVISDTLAEGVYVMDNRGVIVRVNPAACRILGYAADELVGQTAHALFHSHPDNAYLSRDLCPLLIQVARGQPYDGEEHFRCKDGSIRIVQVACRPLLVRGAGIGSVTAFHDITARKLTEAALKASEETARKLSKAVEQSPASVVITDPSGAIEYVNPQFVEKTGYSFEEIVGKNPRILQSGTMARQTYEELWATIRAGGKWKGELHNQRKNGERYWELASISPIRDAAGQITHFIAVKEDVTARKHMEEALREKELIQRTLMESLPVGLVIIDAETRVIEKVNPAVVRLFGADAETIVGHRCHRFLCPAETCNCPILDHGQEVDSSDRIMIRHDGTPMPVLKTVTRITIQGRPKLLECVIDIRSRIAAEDALRQANAKLKVAIATAEELAEKAEAANRSKSLFLSNMSHEIRTPLNAILGYSQLLQQDDTLGSEQIRQVGTINRSGDHLLELINGILEMSKIEAGRIEVQPEPLDLARLLKDVEAMFRLTCQKKGLDLRMERESGLPVRIVADRGKVRQVLVNLMSNAVKFTARGGIRLRASVKMAPDRRWAVSIEVEDTGSGIATAEQQRLFQVFEQTTSGKGALEGTGLGLSISRAYARAMGGDLQLVRSGVDQGAVFRFSFPADPAEGSQDHPAETDRPQRVTGLGPNQPIVRVLVVEDDRDSRELLERLLAGVGFAVRSVDSGEAAVAALEPFGPDLVLTDVQLPGIDGYETARRIRALPGGSRCKLIVVTASGVSSEDIRGKTAAAGVDAFVAKPYKIEEILKTIQRVGQITYHYGHTVAAEAEDDAMPPDHESVRQLPLELRVALQSAVELGDMIEFMRLVDQVTAVDGRLNSHLVQLARQYDYAALLDLLSTAPAPHEQGAYP